jgi:hypothetical protein
MSSNHVHHAVPVGRAGLVLEPSVLTAAFMIPAVAQELGTLQGHLTDPRSSTRRSSPGL